MCFDDKDCITRRTFLKGATAAAAGVVVESATGPPQLPQKALDDPRVAHWPITFKNDGDTINGYLARPKRPGRFRAVVINHGQNGLPEDIRNTAAQMAQKGFVGLAIDPTSRVLDESLASLEVIRSDTYWKRWMRDNQAGIDYLKDQPFVKQGRVGMVGFCGGGVLGLRLSTVSEDVAAVVALYAAPFFRDRNSATDPKPDLMSFVGQIKVPIQCHFGTRDDIIPAADIRTFERSLRQHKVPAEVYLYHGAGHAFYDYTSSTSHDPKAARVAHRRMLAFLKAHPK